jgi:hypothetical protein
MWMPMYEHDKYMLYNSLYGFLSSLGRDERMECIYSTEQCVLIFFACSVGDYQDISDIKL